jgi:hypothetical protein
MNITGFPIADLGDIDLKVSEILFADLGFSVTVGSL